MVNRGKILRTYRYHMDDEYYTFYDDVESHFGRILAENPYVFENKVIYFPCDDFEMSNFPKWFISNQDSLRYKKLVCTSYRKNRDIGGGGVTI